MKKVGNDTMEEYSREEIEEIINQKKTYLEELEEKDQEYIKLLSDIALLQIELGKYKSSEENLVICLKYFKKHKDRIGEASVLGILGTLYFKKKEYDESINHYREAYEIYKELKQIDEAITCLKGIGSSYFKLNKLEKASEVFFDCCDLCSETDNIYNFLDCLGNLIRIYEHQEKWDIVYELYQKTLKTFQKMNDKRGIITSFFNLGIIKKRLKEFGDALNFFKQGTNAAIDSNYSELILKGLSYIGECHFNLGQQNKAKERFIEGIRLANKMGAENARIQLELLLKTMGLTEKEIKSELKKEKNK
ncbi:MAG: tetratricopeptide repeat protein [Promethearchaeota archaeon]|nr:MAG: tetratricopeptide repeat protein [Candidatus Lokiarchaeota archaeon]